MVSQEESQAENQVRNKKKQLLVNAVRHGRAVPGALSKNNLKDNEILVLACRDGIMFLLLL